MIGPLDTMSKSYLIWTSKQEFMQVNLTLFLEKWQGRGGGGRVIRAGLFIGINTILCSFNFQEMSFLLVFLSTTIVT